MATIIDLVQKHIDKYIATGDRAALVEAHHMIEKVLDLHFHNKRRPETTITCAICGAPTDGKNNTKKYCDDCKMTKKKAR